MHRYNRTMEMAIKRAEQVKELLLAKKRTGFEPEVIIVHPGWGDAFFSKRIISSDPNYRFFRVFLSSSWC